MMPQAPLDPARHTRDSQLIANILSMRFVIPERICLVTETRGVNDDDRSSFEREECVIAAQSSLFVKAKASKRALEVLDVGIMILALLSTQSGALRRRCHNILLVDDAGVITSE